MSVFFICYAPLAREFSSFNVCIVAITAFADPILIESFLAPLHKAWFNRDFTNYKLLAAMFS